MSIRNENSSNSISSTVNNKRSAPQDDCLGNWLTAGEQGNSSNPIVAKKPKVSTGSTSVTASLSSAGVLPTPPTKSLIGATNTVGTLSMGPKPPISTATSITKSNTILGRNNHSTTINKPSISSNTMTTARQAMTRNPLLKKADDDANEHKLDQSDYYYALHRDEERVKELFTNVTGERPSLSEYRTAKRIIDKEKAEQRKHEESQAQPPKNSILAMLQKEKSKTMLTNIPFSNSALSGSTSQSIAVLSSLSNPNKPVIGGTVIAGTNQSLIRTPTGAFVSIAGNSTQSQSTTIPSNTIALQQKLQQLQKQKQNEEKQAIHNALQLQNSIKIINNQHIIDYNKLKQNTELLTESSNIKNNLIKLKQEKLEKEKQLMLNIDELLSRKSNHANEAQDEWFEGFNQRMTKLAQREYAQQKTSQINQIFINSFSCKQCQLITETYPDYCKHSNHYIEQIKAIKRFFQCLNCKRRSSTLTHPDRDRQVIANPPSTPCFCGHNNWYRCGLIDAPLSSKPNESSLSDANGNMITGEKLISSASEWSSYQDKLTMAARVSKLD